MPEQMTHPDVDREKAINHDDDSPSLLSSRKRRNLEKTPEVITDEEIRIQQEKKRKLETGDPIARAKRKRYRVKLN